jgi:cysteinyl-tRNA synthetase
VTEIRLHDTMAREKRVFAPADPKRVTMYVCGPTVYGRAHIGNARPAVVFDVLARLLRHAYGQDSLVYARNVTDVDDKIIEAARSEGVEPAVITERFERFYDEDMGALGVQPPSLAPHATHHIAEMVAMIARLIAAGNAYEADGHVLFHVPSDPDYGALGRRDCDAMIAGARVEVASYKKDPADFVLWKPSPEGVIGWDSPWGKGRPGWHIECSAMIEAHLGATIDIHGGGLDLIFPHHENELAQSRCAHEGAPLARYWVHNGFLSMAGSEKMSKSLGNVVSVGELLEHGHQGEVLRLALLSAHYRQPLEWSEAVIKQSESQLRSWYRVKLRVETAQRAFGGSLDLEPNSKVVEALADDLNVPMARAVLSDLYRSAVREPSLTQTLHAGIREKDALLERHRSSFEFIASVNLLGFCSGPASDFFGEPESPVSEIDQLIAERNIAKTLKDYARADRIRARLADDGIILEDGPEGTTWRRA